MNVLGIETATSVCGVALVRNGALVAAREEVRKNIHAERLLPLIAAVLDEAGCSPADLTGIAVSIGPGSFTGLRIGLSAAKGLAWAHGLPVVGVPTLHALALRAVPVVSGGWILPVLEARREEVYCQLHELREEAAVPAQDVRDERTGDLPGLLRMRPLAVTGEGADVLAAVWPEGERAGVTFLRDPHRRCDARLVAREGTEALAAGRSDDLSTLEPRYVKDFFLKVR
jgi:tRNA threonylcarbamoyladenosine biosynthesis protein TsaB